MLNAPSSTRISPAERERDPPARLVELAAGIAAGDRARSRERADGTEVNDMIDVIGSLLRPRHRPLSDPGS